MATSSTLTYPYSLTNGSLIDASSLMGNFQSAATLIGTTGLGTNNIKDSSITGPKLDSGVAGAALSRDGSSNLQVNTDSSTVEVASDTLRLKDSGITLAKVVDGSVTTSKLINGSVTIPKIVGRTVQSTSVAAFTTTSTSFVDVSSNVSITSSGGPIVICLAPTDTSNTGAYWSNIPNGSDHCAFRILRNNAFQIACIGQPSSYQLPSFMIIENPGVGTFTYKLQARAASGGQQGTAGTFSLQVYETL